MLYIGYERIPGFTSAQNSLDIISNVFKHKISRILVQIKYTRKLVKTCPFRFLYDYYDDSLDNMFPQFPNHFLLFSIVFPQVFSSVSTISLGVSTVSS